MLRILTIAIAFVVILVSTDSVKSSKKMFDPSKLKLSSMHKIIGNHHHHDRAPIGKCNKGNLRAREYADQSEECGINSVDYKLRFIDENGEAKNGEFPWLAQITFGNLRCAATIIAKQYLLTAASCVSIGDFGYVDAGFHSDPRDMIQNRRILKIIRHPDFTLSVKDGIVNLADESVDIALVKLEEPLEWSKYVRPICLPDAKEAELNRGTMLTVAGWNRTKDAEYSGPILTTTELPVADLFDCVRSIIENDSLEKSISRHLLCAGKYDNSIFHRSLHCSFDSGGPASMRKAENKKRWVLFGVSSAAKSKIICGFGQYAFTKVTGCVSWIEEVIESERISDEHKG